MRDQIVWDIIRFCKQHGILVQAVEAQQILRSAIASKSRPSTRLELLDLLFERFISESSNEWPDVDLDLPSEEKRKQAIQYVYQRYGELGAAMTANVITYRGKSAARETGTQVGGT